jgi:hypothetical protein
MNACSFLQMLGRKAASRGVHVSEGIYRGNTRWGCGSQQWARLHLLLSNACWFSDPCTRINCPRRSDQIRGCYGEYKEAWWHGGVHGNPATNNNAKRDYSPYRSFGFGFFNRTNTTLQRCPSSSKRSYSKSVLTE